MSVAGAAPSLCCPHYDEPAIPNDAVLYRRLPPWHLHPEPGTPTGKRVAGNAYQDCDPQGVSMYDRDILQQCALRPADIVAGRDLGWGVAEFTAGAARLAGFGVRLRPDPGAAADPLNPAHGELTGLIRGNHGGKQSKKLSRQSAVVLVV